MYWLQRPPYLRWAAAAAALVLALAWDLRPVPTDLRPFAARDADAGVPIPIEWREVPAGILPDVDPAGLVAAIGIESGTPIVPALLTPPIDLPEGWPAIPLEIGSARVPGDSLLLIVSDPPLVSTGLVVEPQRGDSYGFDFSPGLVALPPDDALPIARAARAGTLVIAVAP